MKIVKPVKQALLLLWLRSNAFTVFTGSQFQKAISAINHPFSHPYSLRTEKHDMETVKGVKDAVGESKIMQRQGARRQMCVWWRAVCR